MYKKSESKIVGLRTPMFLILSLLSLLSIAPTLADGSGELIPVALAVEQNKDFPSLLTEGKLEADLGNYDKASVAFTSVAYDETAPTALRWEALVRYGLVLSAAGQAERGREAFKTVLEKYSGEPDAVRFLFYAVTGDVEGKIWLDFKPEFEELLRSAEIVSTEDIGMGANHPKVLYLKRREIELKAIWKPLESRTSSSESSNLDVAAYELDKILELNMVPPTVERIVEGLPGSVQLWIYGCKALREVKDQPPDTNRWNRDMWRVRTFDHIIGNRDRNLGNILIDPSWGLVLIDHNFAFSGTGDRMQPIKFFDRMLVEKLRRLSKVGMQARLEGVLAEQDIENILKRRDDLLTHLEQLIAEKGESAVFF
jgi:tetratricopeptide (TPR) repeat protein